MREDNIFSSLGDSTDNVELRKAIADLYPYVCKRFPCVFIDREMQFVYATDMYVIAATKVAIPDDFPPIACVAPARFAKDVNLKELSAETENTPNPAILREWLFFKGERIGIDSDLIKRAVEVYRRKHLLEDENNKINTVLVAIYNDENKLRGFVHHRAFKFLTQALKYKDATFVLGKNVLVVEFGNSKFVVVLNNVPSTDGAIDPIGHNESESSFLKRYESCLYITRENVATFEKIENEREQCDTYPQAIQNNLSQLYELKSKNWGSKSCRKAIAYQRINRIVYYNDLRTIAIKRPGVTISRDKLYAVSRVPMNAIDSGGYEELPYDRSHGATDFYECSIDWNEEDPEDYILIGRIKNSAYGLNPSYYERIKNYLKKTKQLNGTKCYVEPYPEGRLSVLHIYTVSGDIILTTLNSGKGELCSNCLEPLSSDLFYPHLYAAIATQINYALINRKGDFYLSETVTANSLCSVLGNLLERRDLRLFNEVKDIFRAMVNLMPYYKSKEQAKEIIDLFIDELNQNFLADTVKQQESHSQDSEKPTPKAKGTPKNKYDLNAQIRSLIDGHRAAGKAISDYTQDDIELMLQYSGDGGNKNADVEKGGALNEFYTPDFVCEIMYDLAKKYGYTKGKVLEPSCAIGNMIAPFVKNANAVCVDAFEVNDYTAEICEARFAKSDIPVHVRRDFFETAFLLPPRFTSRLPKNQTSLGNNPYDIVIGNPPYGKHVNKYTSYFTGKENFKQAELFFISKCLDLLRSGGLLVFIVPCSVLANAISKETEIICAKCEITDAYRLPPVFGATNICTDIIVLRKK